MSDAELQYFTKDLIRWSETLAAIARTGIGFTQSLYERERFEEILKVAGDIKCASDESLDVRREKDHFVQEWMESIGQGVPGYVTPKVAIGAIVGNDEGKILLMQRADSGVWLYPTGWADVGYSASEVVNSMVIRLKQVGLDGLVQMNYQLPRQARVGGVRWRLTQLTALAPQPHLTHRVSSCGVANSK